jgi:threonyl-tRNA synthetase
MLKSRPAASAINELCHRQIGARLKLIHAEESSPGSVFFQPAGLHIIHQIKRLLRAEYHKYGFAEVSTPILFSPQLWKQSGHYDKYAENMFFIHEEENAMGMKAMNCPAHCLLYASKSRSYRDLPIRFADFTSLHRNELRNTLTGLTRLRQFHQDDGHMFCTEDQVQKEISNFLKLVQRVLIDVFKFKNYSVALSTRPDNFLGSLKDWELTESILENVLKDSGLNYSIKEKDGAFYGPKIDIHVTDSLNRAHQLSTLQLDSQLPERFDLKYFAADGSLKRPVMIHRAVLGSLERFFAVWLESIAGKIPFWCSPYQAIIIPLKSNHLDYAENLRQELSVKYPEDPLSPRYEVNVDRDFDETLPKRIKTATLNEYIFAIVIGDKEVETGLLSVRNRDSSGKPQQKFTAADLKSEFLRLEHNFL